jgi:hypothetical protein
MFGAFMTCFRGPLADVHAALNTSNPAAAAINPGRAGPVRPALFPFIVSPQTSFGNRSSSGIAHNKAFI